MKRRNGIIEFGTLEMHVSFVDRVVPCESCLLPFMPIVSPPSIPRPMRARILGIQFKLPALTTGAVLSTSVGRTIGQISKADRLGLGAC